jgi:hypothetical protein
MKKYTRNFWPVFTKSYLNIIEISPEVTGVDNTRVVWLEKNYFIDKKKVVRSFEPSLIYSF